MRVSHAELYTGSFVGDPAVEDEQENVALKDLAPVQLEHREAAFFPAHPVVRRPVVFGTVALRQEHSKPARSSRSVSSRLNRLSAAENSGPAK